MQLATQLAKRWLLPTFLFSSVIGCQSAPKEIPAKPADEDTVRLIRQSFMAADPKAVVGLVIAVLPGDNFAAVGDVDVKTFSEGEVITFIDTDKKPLIDGVVKKITADALHVMYTAPKAGERAPRVGDLAVRFKP